MQLCRNRDGKLFDNSRNYPKLLREEVLDLNHNGMSQRAIARELKTSCCFIQNVLADYDSALQHLQDPPERRIMNPEVISCIETEKLMKPSVYVRELQDRLLFDGVVHPLDLLSKSAISKCFREDLYMTKKKIQQIPSESQRNENIHRQNEFLESISDLEPGTLHCFDEGSVVKTTCNRKYRNAPRGEPAFEIQWYALSVPYTINLLHSPFGIDFMNVLEGPSNGQELLLFFEEAVNLTRAVGSPVLERGDSVIMDNCAFHHGHFVEPILTALLANCRIRLLFQPPYSPEFNTCELCFHDIKEFLRRNQRLAEEETAYAI